MPEGVHDRESARGLLAAFAWAAADVASLTCPSAVLATVADVIGWEGFSVFVFEPAEDGSLQLSRTHRRAEPDRIERLLRTLGDPPQIGAGSAALDACGWEGEWTASTIDLPAASKGLLVVEGERLSRSDREAVAAFARLASGVLARLDERARLEMKLAHRAIADRSVIAAERLSALGEAAAVLAHEMRNPLGTIANALSLLRRPDGERDPLALNIVHEEVSRLDALVHDLLQLARPIDPTRRRVDLKQLVEKTVDRVQRSLGGTAPSLSLDAPTELVEVIGDPALLSLALENVLRNAVQASPPRSEIRVAVHVADEDVVVSVEDEGSGIAPALREEIFEPFFTTRAVGVGLGLSIVRRLVEAHGGSVRVGTSRSGGARFDLLLARSPAASAPLHP